MTRPNDVKIPVRHRLKDWLIQEASPDAKPEPWPDGRSFFRGFLIGAPFAVLLWVGIIKGVSWALR